MVNVGRLRIEQTGIFLNESNLLNGHLPPKELLLETHDFPCPYTFKVIGESGDEFVQNIVAAVRFGMKYDFDPPFQTKQTAAGRYVSLTFEPVVENPDQILAVYAELQQQQGVILLL